MSLTTNNALHGHTSEETAYVVDDYPYGFRLRTQIRYWIETSARHGDRLVSQTLNPKTDRWNKPKKSTYALVGCMYLDEDSHVTWSGIGWYTSDEETARFLAVMSGHLSDAQKKQAAVLLAGQKVRKNVTVTIHEGPYTDEDRAEQDAVKRDIARAVNREIPAQRRALDETEGR